jgi:3-hydroxyisobutyrate dehydrogenase
MSTVGVDWSDHLVRLAAGHGVTLVDARVSGSSQPAEDGRVLSADAAYNHGLELPLTAALLGRWHQVIALGHGEDDVASAITVSAVVTSGQEAHT